MRRHVRWSVLVALASLAPLVYGDDDKDRDKLEGTWRFVSLESDGEMAPAEIIEKWRCVIRGSEITIGEPGQGEHKASLKIDSGAKPKTLDMTALDGDEKGKQFKGIYELDGERLKICVPEGKRAEVDRPRPEEFDGGKGNTLFVLERVKDDPK